jgi:hypothetical protein
MIYSRRRSYFAVAFGFVVLAPLSSASGGTCRAADAKSASIISALKHWVTTQDPDRIRQRDSVFHVPVVPVNQITLVTDERTCAKVAQSFANLAVRPYVPASLYVIKMGTKYFAAYDPNRAGGEFTEVHILNSKLVVVGGWAA